MRHIFALSFLLATIAPLTLLAQPAPPPAAVVKDKEEPAWLNGAITDLDRTRSDALAAAKTRIIGWLNEAAAKEEARLARVHVALGKMADAKLPPDRRNELATAVAEAFAADRSANADALMARLKPLFKEMAGPFKDDDAARAAAGVRAGARDVLIALVAGQGRTWPVVPQAIDGLVGDYLVSKDLVIQVDAAMIVAKSNSMLLVPWLIKGLDSPAVSVRYWSAKGLADAQLGMYEMAATGMDQFKTQMKALEVRFAKENTPAVMMELFRALSATDPPKMADPARNAVIYKSFTAVFRSRLDLFEKGTVTNLDVTVAGLAAAAQWEQAFRLAKAMPSRAEDLGLVSQTLWWAFDAYLNRKDSLSEASKAGLEQLMLKAAEVIGNSLTDADYRALGIDPAQKMELFTTVKRGLETGDLPTPGLKILEWVGQPGVECLLNRIGVASAPKAPAPPPPASAPADAGN